mgnify:CR=1 FL=1
MLVKMNSSWTSALFFVALGALTFWLWQQLDEGQEPVAKKKDHEPDYYIEHMVRRSMDETGAVRNILYADMVLHYPDDDSTELTKPRLEIYNGRQDPWYVIAETGWISSGNEVVLLHGEVEIWREGNEGERSFEVLTSELRVLPQEKYAETDNEATINSPSSVTTSIGLRANFAHDRLELLERVRSRHEVEPSS